MYRAILHDEEHYPQPEVFKPERHLSTDGKVIEDPLLEYAFGFGTRFVTTIYCVRKHLNMYAQKMSWSLVRAEHTFHRTFKHSFFLRDLRASR